MKELLAVMLLLIAVLAIYSAVVRGPDGMEAKIKQGGGGIRHAIERINP